MGYWQTKVLPKIKRVFETKTSTKKAAAAEACKSFDDSKEEITKEFEEKKADLQAKVIELYEASSSEIKTLVKERKESGLKKYSAAVLKFLEELAKIEFPGSKPVSEASSKYGPAYVSGPVFFVFEKVSTFIVIEEKVEPPLPAEAAKTEEETSGGVKEKEIVIEEEVVEEKKEEVMVEEKEEEVEKPKPTEPDAAAEAPPPKVEESAAAEPPKL
ncbi:plasma membrane-associated cation-binding protein 1 [Pyrus x bretschneideri]|uniref:plasma membrane-associated cation-binding protein 1 n=1 Tax=Pyrus x bretschneideri TaxID=225117 RepID=UPI000511A746|nr:plasma membrane-associated cation-binding protein 1 [Pyrus x bretschneideri]XP_048429661.1 plasma membrane-associated cation-binding protein 1 [Pyrus x bretschneideri]XP_048429662.1 plasma membrane-associated cation-binding protein 1 [Pyrus x bretschneideri]